MFYIKTKDLSERTDLICFLKSKEILSVFHYVPLHSAPAGKRFGRFYGEDNYTTKESEKLVRLPIYYGMNYNDVSKVCNEIYNFFVNK